MEGETRRVEWRSIKQAISHRANYLVFNIGIKWIQSTIRNQPPHLSSDPVLNFMCMNISISPVQKYTFPQTGARTHSCTHHDEEMKLCVVLITRSFVCLSCTVQDDIQDMIWSDNWWWRAAKCLQTTIVTVQSINFKFNNFEEYRTKFNRLFYARRMKKICAYKGKCCKIVAPFGVATVNMCRWVKNTLPVRRTAYSSSSFATPLRWWF